MRGDAIAEVAAAFVAGIPECDKVSPRFACSEDGSWVRACERVLKGDFTADGIRDADAWDEWRADASGDGFDDPSVTLFHRKLEGVDVIDAIDHTRYGLSGF